MVEEKIKILQIIISPFTSEYLPIIYNIEYKDVSKQYLELLTEYCRKSWKLMPRDISLFILQYIASPKGSLLQSISSFNRNTALMGPYILQSTEIVAQFYFTNA